MNTRRMLGIVVVLTLLILVVPTVLFSVSDGSGVGNPRSSLLITELVAQVRGGKVCKLLYYPPIRVRAVYKDTDGSCPTPPSQNQLQSSRISNMEGGTETSLQGYLLANGVAVAALPEIEVVTADNLGFGAVLQTTLPLLLLAIVFIVVLNRAARRNGKGEGSEGNEKGEGDREGGGNGRNSNDPLMNFGRSRARFYKKFVRPTVTFADVAGIDEAKVELSEVVEFLREPERFAALGARIPRGVLLIGQPGMGKTLIAKALAGEANVPFFSISGSEFVELFAGVGASRVRDLFAQAKRNAPCIIFIDEIDAVGRQRGTGPSINDEREQTLNQVLVEMDGFDTRTNVIVVAATNRPDILDQALLRPGRFDRQVRVDAPDAKGREQILRVHSRGKPLATDIDLPALARLTAGFSGADLANVMNEGAILAARRARKTISMSEVEEAIDRVIGGPARVSRQISDSQRRLAAYHEVGHAIVARMLANTDPVQKLTIVPRGRAGGFTRTVPDEGYERQYLSQGELRDMIAFALGGTVAEEIVLGEASTGASSDIARASNIARKMIQQFGMSKRFGPLSLVDSQGRTNFSDQMAYSIDLEIQGLLNEGHQRAFKILTENRALVEVITNALLEKESLGGPEFEGFFPTPRPKPTAPNIPPPGGGQDDWKPSGVLLQPHFDHYSDRSSQGE